MKIDPKIQAAKLESNGQGVDPRKIAAWFDAPNGPMPAAPKDASDRRDDLLNSQKTRLNWGRMRHLTERWLPPAPVLHPLPEQRFAVLIQGMRRTHWQCPHAPARGQAARPVPTATRIPDNDSEFVTPPDLLSELREDGKALLSSMRGTRSLRRCARCCHYQPSRYLD
jgi:hypothetical protein